jgi:hypothetical protein
MAAPASAEPPRPHVCDSCGRSCGACSRAAGAGQPLPHTVREPWCMWCKRIYADNAPDPETGRVHCAGCEAPFPGLAAFVAAGLNSYPRLCRACRAEAPEPPPPDRGHDAPAHDPLPPLVPPDQPIEREYRRGGFAPRPGPETRESEHGSGSPVEWPGCAPRWG